MLLLILTGVCTYLATAEIIRIAECVHKKIKQKIKEKEEKRKKEEEVNNGTTST